MKRLVFCLVLFNGLTAFAEAPKTLNLEFAFNVDKCLQDGQGSQAHFTCNAVGPSQTGTSISLDNCLPQTDGSSFCSGSWQGTVTTDGYKFMAEVYASASTDAQGTASYTLSGVIFQTGNDGVSAAFVVPDSSFHFSETVVAGNNVISSKDSMITYSGILDMNVANSGAQIKPEHHLKLSTMRKAALLLKR